MTFLPRLHCTVCSVTARKPGITPRPVAERPRSAFYPFLVGTSTEEPREHAIDRWHLPHYMADIVVDFKESASRIRRVVGP